MSVASIARRLGLPVIVDWDSATVETWKLVDFATHVITDEEVASQIGGPQIVLEEFRKRGVWGAVTLGERGVVTEKGWMRAFKVPIRDTTGAGDVFHGAFALAAAQGHGEEESVRYASAAAASRCALGEVPRLEHVERVLSGLPVDSWREDKGETDGV